MGIFFSYSKSSLNSQRVLVAWPVMLVINVRLIYEWARGLEEKIKTKELARKKRRGHERAGK